MHSHRKLDLYREPNPIWDPAMEEKPPLQDDGPREPEKGSVAIQEMVAALLRHQKASGQAS